MSVLKSLKFNYIIISVLIITIIIFSIFLPLFISKKSDANILDKIMYEKIENNTTGYIYKLSTNEKLYMLSKVLNDYFIPESTYTDLVNEKISGENLKNPKTQYAIIKNNRDTSQNEIGYAQILEKCKKEIKQLQKLNFINEFDFDIKKEIYSTNLYSVFDIFEPQKNVVLWQVHYNKNKKLTKYENVLVDAYLDGETGKIYGFSINIQQDFKTMDIDNMAKIWCEYLDIGTPTAYDEKTDVFETASSYKKYYIDGINENKTVITIGFYENTKELFLKTS